MIALPRPLAKSVPVALHGYLRPLRRVGQI